MGTQATRVEEGRCPHSTHPSVVLLRPGRAAASEWSPRSRSGSPWPAPGEGRPPFVEGLNRSDRSEVIARALLARGHKARVAEKVLGANFQRVFAQTWSA